MIEKMMFDSSKKGFVWMTACRPEENKFEV
jgi:hypothetical protein